jgi:hypothetical protein
MDYVGSKLHNTLGEEIGTVTDVIYRAIDLAPEWVTVKKGLLGHEHLLPVSALTERVGMLMTTVSPDLIKHSPVVNEHITPTKGEAHEVLAALGLEDDDQTE